jgi:hypothetical protein
VDAVELFPMAEMGVLITLAKPTRGMRDAANHAGYYVWQIDGRAYPKDPTCNRRGASYRPSPQYADAWREDFARLDSFLEKLGRQKVDKGRRMKLDGAEIVRRHRTEDGPPDFVGVKGGFPPKGKGAPLQELIANQSWVRRPFEVQYGGSCPDHVNWGTVEDLSTPWARPRSRPNGPKLGPSFTGLPEPGCRAPRWDRLPQAPLFVGR